MTRQNWVVKKKLGWRKVWRHLHISEYYARAQWIYRSFVARTCHSIYTFKKKPRWLFCVAVNRATSGQDRPSENVTNIPSMYMQQHEYSYWVEDEIGRVYVTSQLSLCCVDSMASLNMVMIITKAPNTQGSRKTLCH